MSLELACSLIPDHLERYHPYTVAYRKPGSLRYRDFSPLSPFEPESLLQRANELGEADGADRKEVASILVRELTRCGASPLAIANAERLTEKKTFCIIAGHQPALFGGPLFLVLKLLGATALCRRLNQMSDFHFVPLYWNGSEEHNRSEFGRVTFFDNEHDLIHLALPPDGARRMASRTPASEALSLLAEAAKLLPRTEFSERILQTVRDAGQNDLGEMQTRLMLQWFSEQGLLVAEPHWFRRQSVPVLQQALSSCQPFHQALLHDTEEMKSSGFTPQLPLHEEERTTVFHLQEGERFRIRVQGAEHFSLEKRQQSFSKAELFDRLQQCPEEFSPSAALRPIVQSYLFPTVAYVAGGGELAYHFQLRRSFALFETTMPLLVPRPAATILKGSARKAMNRIRLAPEGLLQSGWTWDDVAASTGERTASQQEAFETFFAALHKGFDTLTVELEGSGVSGTGRLEKERDRMISRLEGMAAQFRQQDPALAAGPKRQFHRFRKFALPAEGYQELSAWSLYFLCLYGEEFFSELARNLDPFALAHHLFVAQ